MDEPAKSTLQFLRHFRVIIMAFVASRVYVYGRGNAHPTYPSEGRG